MLDSRYGDVAVSVDAHVATLELQRAPENFIDAVAVASLADALDAAETEKDVRAILLCAAGEAFSAGVAPGPVPTWAPGEGPVRAHNPLYLEGARLFRTAKPIVAAIQGRAVGAGLGLALAADFRIGGPGARFVADSVSLGYHPGFASSYLLPRAIGAQRAAWMCLTGDAVNADQAFAWGLLDRLTEKEPRIEAVELCRKLAAHSPLAVQSIRATLRADLEEGFSLHSSREHARQSALIQTADFAEAIRSQAEGRTGRFVGG